MKRFHIYLIWSLIALGLVGASVAVPVALAKVKEREMLDRVIVLEADEVEQLYVTRSIPFEQQAGIFANANLDAKIARDAYPAELSKQDALDKADVLARRLMGEMREEWVQQFNSDAFTVDKAMKYVRVTVTLYESPSDTTKIAYWQVLYEWAGVYSDDKLMPESWPLYYLEINCDTTEGRPYSVIYRFYPFVSFVEEFGVQAFAEALGAEASLEVAEHMPGPTAAIVEGASEIWDGKAVIFYLLDSDEEICIVKTLWYQGVDCERIQVIPRSFATG